MLAAPIKLSNLNNKNRSHSHWQQSNEIRATKNYCKIMKKSKCYVNCHLMLFCNIKDSKYPDRLNNSNVYEFMLNINVLKCS